MKIKRLLILAVIPMMCLTAIAQNHYGRENYTPKKGDFTVAATVGYNSYANITAPSGLLTDYEVAALSTNWTDKKLMVGFEAGWFFSDKWKLNVGGGLNFTNNPGYPAKIGTYEDGIDEVGDGSVPNYRAVGDASSLAFNVFTGVDRYFKVKSVAGLLWYAGARAGYAYGQNRVKYDEPESLGKSVAETYNLRGSLTVGLDYYLVPGLYVGCQIDPFAYTYNTTTYKPQEGLGNLSADSHNFSLLAAPAVKVGFKF
jgi:hypothetical protein